MQTCVPSMSGMSEIPAYPPIADDPSALPSPISSLSSSSSCLFTWCQPLYASCCIVQLYFSRYCTVRLKMFSLFFFFFSEHLLCVQRSFTYLTCSNSTGSQNSPWCRYYGLFLCLRISVLEFCSVMSNFVTPWTGALCPWGFSRQ